MTDNRIQRYAIGDRDELQFNKNGSLDIYIQHSSPGREKESNWLPAPKGDFDLVLRAYWPVLEVLTGSWKPPAVERVRRSVDSIRRFSINQKARSNLCTRLSLQHRTLLRCWVCR